MPTVQDAEFRLDEVFAGLNLQQVKVVATRNFGAPIRRNQDARLLSGQALFVDDVELPGMVHAAFLRSNVAHARIRSIDVSAARARDGVVAVYTAADLGDYWAPGPLLVPPPPIADTIFNQRTERVTLPPSNP